MNIASAQTVEAALQPRSQEPDHSAISDMLSISTYQNEPDSIPESDVSFASRLQVYRWVV